MEERKERKNLAHQSRIFFVVGLILFFIFSFFWSRSFVRAAAPSIVTYQGKLLNSANAPISTATNMTFVLYDAPTAGNALYTAGGTLGTPTAVSITPSSGIFSVNFGDTGTNPLDTQIFRDNGAVYLEITIGAEILTPRKQITSAPYAINSLYLDGYGAKTVSSSAYIPLSDSQGNFQFNTISSGNLFVSGTSTFSSSTIASTTITTANIRDLNLSGTISGLTLPIGSISGTNVLAFLANNQSFSGLNTFSATTTFTTTTVASATLTAANISNLVVDGTVLLPNNSITDAMIPDTITASNYLLLAGGTLTGGINAGNQALTNVGSLSVNGSYTNNGLAILNGGFIAASSTVTSTFTVTGALNASSTLAVSGIATFSATSTFATSIGIATSSPLAALTVQDGSILAAGSAGGTPYEGPGTRLMWIPNKSAFRAGEVTGAQWDAANIGSNSAAFGYNNQVSANYGFAAGFGNTVSGDNGAFSFGRSNTVSGNFAAAFGNGNTASNQGSFAGGFSNAVSGEFSLAYGQGNTVGGTYSGAFGASNNIGGFYSFGLGQSNVVAGSNSVALGTGMVVNGNGSVGVGLGSGGTISRSNVFGILGGSVGIGTVDPGFTLSVTGTLGVSATSTFVTTTAASSTIENGNITSLFANTATITNLTVTSCTGCSGGAVSLTGDQTFTGLNTFTATTTLATTTVVGDIVPTINNLYDVGSSSTRWRYLNVQGGVVVSNGVTTSTLENGSLVLGQTVGSNLGKFYIDSSGNISTSGTLRVTGNILPSYVPTYSNTARTTSTIDAVNNAGRASSDGDGMTSLIVNADGLPLIAYPANNNDLVVTKCGDATCTSGNIKTTVVTAALSGNDVTLAIGSDGLPVIAYYDSNQSKVGILHCGNLACSSGNQTNFAGVTGDGYYLSMQIGIDGFPAIGAYEFGNNDLRFIHCLDILCSTSTERLIDAGAGTVGFWVSLAIGSDGNPIFAHNNINKGSLDFARCGDPGCIDSAKIATSTLDNTGGGSEGAFVSLTVGNDGLPIMAYRDDSFNRLIVLRCLNLACTVTEAGQEVNSAVPNPAKFNSLDLAIGVDGFPVVSYQSNDRLFIFKCNSVGCATVTSTLVDVSAGTTGRFSSLAIAKDGRPMVAYTTLLATYQLDFLQCAGIDCMATTTRVITGGSDLGSGGAFFNNVYANQFWGKKFKVAAFDVAEEYPTADPSLSAGEVVAFDEQRPGYVKRADDSAAVVGIISTQPGLLLSEWENEASGPMQVPIALSGRVPLRVSSENGPIMIGDRLVLSQFPGIAAKSMGGAPTIGIAMEAFSASSTRGVITAFVNLAANGSADNVYQGLTVNDDEQKITFGTTTAPYSVVLNGGLSVVDPALVTLSFSTTTLLTTHVQDFENAKAFILNAQNFSPTSPSDRILFSLRSQDIPVFSVAANGDVNTIGNYYGASATFGSSTNPGDLAERVDIAFDDTAEAGDVMIVDPNSPDTYRRSNTPYDSAVAGVISSNPTIIVGRGKTDHTANLAMVGRVPVKVVNENGSIQRGDLLVASSRPGYAMKYDPTLDSSSKVVGIIGIALDPLVGEQGKIAALIRTGWVYSQTKTLTDLQATVDSLAGTNSENLGTSLEAMSVTSNGDRLTLSKDLSLGGHALLAVGRIEGLNNAWEIDAEGNARVKKLTADQVITPELVITPNADTKKTTIGEATIAQGETSVRVENDIFTTSTKIFITFVNNPKHFWWVSKKENGSFTVSFDTAAEEDSAFDYWLVPTTAVDNLTVPPPGATPAPEVLFVPSPDVEAGSSTVEGDASADLSASSTSAASNSVPDDDAIVGSPPDAEAAGPDISTSSTNP